MTTLLLDIGNSRLKWGVLVDGAIRDTGSLPVRNIAQADAVFEEKLPQQIASAIACNVAGPEVATALGNCIDARYGITPRFIQSTESAGDVQNAYAEPGRLGVDRWVALIGARAATSAACLVVDAGTAITLDAMDRHGRHLGGQILPGLRLMAGALNRNTSDLPGTESDTWLSVEAAKPFANSTRDAIAQGIMSAVLGSIDRGMRAIGKLDADASLVLTGGDAGAIRQQLQLPADFRPDLVLEGLACLARAEPTSSSVQPGREQPAR